MEVRGQRIHDSFDVGQQLDGDSYELKAFIAVTKADANKASGRLRLLAAAALLLVFVTVVSLASVYALSPSLFEADVRLEDSEETASIPLSNDEFSGSSAGIEESIATEAITPEEAYANSTIIATTDAQSSPSSLTEADAARFLTERGFNSLVITAGYDLYGSYIGEEEIDVSSSDAHPVYEATYITPNENVWTLHLCGSQLMAFPLTFNNENSNAKRPPFILSEKETISSYYSATNSFYEIIPDSSRYTVITIPTIDAETIDDLTLRKIERL